MVTWFEVESWVSGERGGGAGAGRWDTCSCFFYGRLFVFEIGLYVVVAVWWDGVLFCACLVEYGGWGRSCGCFGGRFLWFRGHSLLWSGWGGSSGFLSGTVRDAGTGFTIKLGYPISVRLVMFQRAPADSTGSIYSGFFSFHAIFGLFHGVGYSSVLWACRWGFVGMVPRG